MLSSLSSYLFNTTSPLEDVTNLRNNAEYQTQELDDDWLLVNALGENTEETTSPSDSSETELSDSRSTSPNQTVKRNQNQVSRRSRNPVLKLRVPTSTPDRGSPPSSPNQQMDGSWYVTPPPCFTASTGPVAIESSPMENLLIEHPSMSVYGPIPSFSFSQGSQRSDSSDTSPVRDLDLWVPRTATPRNSSVDRNAVSDDQEVRVSCNARRNTHRGISCSNSDSALEERRFLIHSQSYQKQREQRKMKPSYLERQNLVRQYQSYRRQRNHHHLKQPIKFCNNRC